MFDTLKLAVALVKDRRGVTAVEYAVVAGVLATAIGLSFNVLGTRLSSWFNIISL